MVRQYADNQSIGYRHEKVSSGVDNKLSLLFWANVFSCLLVLININGIFFCVTTQSLHQECGVKYKQLLQTCQPGIVAIDL